MYQFKETCNGKFMISKWLSNCFYLVFLKESLLYCRFLAATKMEPTYARNVFPCFDEPEMKAVFNFTIIHRRDTMALGNEHKSGEKMSS